jgi:multidrug transporter EmrE-like cation transporter
MDAVWYLIILGLTFITVVGDSLLKMAGEHKDTNYSHLLGCLLIYLLTGLIWFLIYKHIKFSISGSVYGVITALVFTLVGIFYFHETLRPIEIIGIVLGISSIFLLSRFGN